MSAHDREVSIPVSLLSSLLVAESASSAHYKLCTSAHFGTSLYSNPHPGDPLGNVAGWLWIQGEAVLCARLVTDYLSEIRVHNPHSPAVGNRITWDELKIGLTQATSSILNQEQNRELIEYLDEQVPRLYGESPKRLNEK